MKFCLPFILAVAAFPAFAQQKLPFEFFLECDGSEKGELLVLVKGNVFFFKKPILKFDTFENNSDALTTGGFYPSLFNKWNSNWHHCKHNCEQRSHKHNLDNLLNLQKVGVGVISRRAVNGMAMAGTTGEMVEDTNRWDTRLISCNYLSYCN